MMKWWMFSRGLWRVWIPGGSLLVLGGCGLSDAQLTAVLQSVITTGLNTFLVQLIATLLGAATAAA
ncbi:MAG: hypothetical protein ACE5I3_03435 [Phycisphaerae bacterium]